MFEALLERIAELQPQWLLVMAFFLPLGETVALIDAAVPGELGLLAVGAAAPIADVPIVLVIAVASVGAFLGDTTSWYVGHRWGTTLLTRWEPIRVRIEGPLATAEHHFTRFGGPMVFGARFVGPLRALVPLVAGTSGMSYRKFVPWNAAASVGWVTLVVMLGAVFG
ncbi:MAG: DedA family protein, partial [Actinomycetia bacterium]|nr:DedA family protein [Actinomycetes bacterium]